MATIQARVEDYVGTLTDTQAISDHATAGAKHLIDVLPREKLIRLTTELTDAGSGIAVTGRFIRAHKSDVGTIEVNPSLKAQVQDSDSIHYAPTNSPVHLWDDNKVYVYPSGGSVIHVAYPTVTYSDTSISGFPSEMEHVVILYTAIQEASSILNTTLSSITSADYTSQMTALSFTNANTYVNTDEDIELGNAELSKLGLQLSEMQTKIQDEKADVDVDLQKNIVKAQSMIGVIANLRTEYKTLLEAFL